MLRERKGGGRHPLYHIVCENPTHITVRLQELEQVTWDSVTPGPARTSLGPKMLLLCH